MQATNLRDFSKQMTGLCVIYNRQNSSELTEIYFNTLAEYDYKDVVEAISKYIKIADSASFFPKPGDLIKMLEGEGNTQALQAFSKVTTSGCGWYDTVVFDDPIIHKVIRDLGGWERWCNRDTQYDSFLEKRFCERYNGYRLNPPADYPKAMVGLYGLDKEIKMIGNQEKAQLVFKQAPAAEILKIKSLAVTHDKPELKLVAQR